MSFNIFGWLMLALVQLSGACVVFFIGHHIGVLRGYEEYRKDHLKRWDS